MEEYNILVTKYLEKYGAKDIDPKKDCLTWEDWELLAGVEPAIVCGQPIIIQAIDLTSNIEWGE